MKRPNLLSICYVLLLALLAGCGPVTASKPLPVAKLSAGERAQFAGTWVAGRNEHDVFTVRFVCDGVARVASVVWEGGKFRLAEAELTVSQGKPRGHEAPNRYLSLRTLGDKHNNDYLFVRYQFLSPDEIVLWPPAPQPYQEAVKRGKLKGETLARGDVRIADPEALLEFIDTEEGAPRFRYQEPAVLHKVAEGAGEESLPACK